MLIKYSWSGPFNISLWSFTLSAKFTDLMSYYNGVLYTINSKGHVFKDYLRFNQFKLRNVHLILDLNSTLHYFNIQQIKSVGSMEGISSPITVVSKT